MQKLKAPCPHLPPQRDYMAAMDAQLRGTAMESSFERRGAEGAAPAAAASSASGKGAAAAAAKGAAGGENDEEEEQVDLDYNLVKVRANAAASCRCQSCLVVFPAAFGPSCQPCSSLCSLLSFACRSAYARGLAEPAGELLVAGGAGGACVQHARNARAGPARRRRQRWWGRRAPKGQQEGGRQRRKGQVSCGGGRI